MGWKDLGIKNYVFAPWRERKKKGWGGGISHTGYVKDLSSSSNDCLTEVPDMKRGETLGKVV